MDGWMDVLTAVGLTRGGTSTVHIYTQTIHRTIQLVWSSGMNKTFQEQDEFTYSVEGEGTCW